MYFKHETTFVIQSADSFLPLQVHFVTKRIQICPEFDVLKIAPISMLKLALAMRSDENSLGRGDA